MDERMIGPDRGTDELGRDMELARALAVLDPAKSDPNYWLQFRKWVVDSAGPELARRRLMAQVTMADVFSSWARTLLPTAALAAAVAGIMLLRAPSTEVAQVVSVEELLLLDVEGESIPATLEIDEQDGVATFAGESF